MASENLEGMDRIRSIVRDLTTFSRIDRGEVEMVQINDLVDAACNMAFNEIKHRARLVKDLAPVPFIAGHRGKLGQLITNLLVNAAHAIEAGAADSNQIKIVTRHVAQRVSLWVVDSGAGIAEEHRSQVFAPFFTTKDRGVGTGLGLALCAEIARTHGGDLDFDSEVGKGTTFKVSLPEDTGLTLTPAVSALPPCATEQPPARVLVVDDEEPVCKALRRMLGATVDVVIAKGGAEALRVLREERGTRS